MNSTNFEEWFHDKLMPNILPNSIIVLDNVSHHTIVDTLNEYFQHVREKLMFRIG